MSVNGYTYTNTNREQSYFKGYNRDFTIAGVTAGLMRTLKVILRMSTMDRCHCIIPSLAARHIILLYVSGFAFI